MTAFRFTWNATSLALRLSPGCKFRGFPSRGENCRLGREQGGDGVVCYLLPLPSCSASTPSPTPNPPRPQTSRYPFFFLVPLMVAPPNLFCLEPDVPHYRSRLPISFTTFLCEITPASRESPTAQCVWSDSCVSKQDQFSVKSVSHVCERG